MNRTYLLLLIVVIVGLVAIFALSFLTSETGQNLSGAWSIGGFTCKGYDTSVCEIAPRTKNECEACGGKWVREARER